MPVWTSPLPFDLRRPRQRLRFYDLALVFCSQHNGFWKRRFGHLLEAVPMRHLGARNGRLFHYNDGPQTQKNPLDMIRWVPPPPPDTHFVQAKPYSCNRGIFNKYGTARPTPHYIWVDDNFFAGIPPPKSGCHSLWRRAWTQLSRSWVTPTLWFAHEPCPLKNSEHSLSPTPWFFLGLFLTRIA